MFVVATFLVGCVALAALWFQDHPTVLAGKQRAAEGANNANVESAGVSSAVATSSSRVRNSIGPAKMSLAVQSGVIRDAGEVVICAQYKQDKWEADVLLQQPVEGANTIQLAWREESLASINARLATSATLCEGNAHSQESIYPKLLQAAQLGDLDSAVCYVEAPFPLDADQLSPLGLQEYRKNALALLDIGIRRGDWRFVELMRTAEQRAGMGHRGHDSRSWFHRLVEPNAKDAYMYARLEQLGAGGAFSEQIGGMVASWRDGLSGSDIDALDQRASDNFNQYFAKKPPLEEFPKLCGF